MSDFDKEAEREKLREKYGDEEQRREATEQMSELLLQGATMTNAHCNDCGDPVFRYDGTEFCPTCEKRVDRDTESVTEDGDADAAGSETEAAADAREDTASDSRTVEVTAPDDDARVRFGGSGGDPDAAQTDPASTQRAPEETAPRANAGETGGEQPAGDHPDQSRDPTGSTGTEDHSSRRVEPNASGGVGGRARTGVDAAGESSDEATPDERVPSLQPGSGEAGAATQRPAQSGPADATASDSLEQARRALAATVERFSRRALETDSPRQAREYLETAREAAATLDATEF